MRILVKSFLNFLALSQVQESKEYEQQSAGVTIKKKDTGVNSMRTNTSTSSTNGILSSNPFHRRNLAPTSDIQYHHARWEPLGDAIVGEAEYEETGHSIVLSDDGLIIAISAPFSNVGGSSSGQVRMLRFNDAEQEWIPMGNRINGKSLEWLGFSLNISGDGRRIVIGGPNASTSGGVVRVYEIQDNDDEWQQLGSDLQGESENDNFGWSVAMSNDGAAIAVGAFGNDGIGASSGSAQVYVEGLASWEQVGEKLSGTGANDRFGYSISLSGDALTLAIGAPGAGYTQVYKFQEEMNGGRDWIKDGDVLMEDSSDWFGRKVSLSGNSNYLAIFGSNDSLVKVYQRYESKWLQVGSDISVNNWARVSLSYDGKSMVVGNRFDDAFGEDAGVSQVFYLCDNTWEQVGNSLYSLDDAGTFSTLAQGHNFGSSVAISRDGSTVAVGASLSSLEGKTKSGHVRVFKMVKEASTLPPSQSPNESPSQPSMKSHTLVIGIAVAGITIIMIAAIVIYWQRKKKSTLEKPSLDSPPSSAICPGNGQNDTSKVGESIINIESNKAGHVLISARFLGDETERRARELYQELHKAGVNVFMVNAGAGQAFGTQVNSGLTNMEVLLAVCSSNYGEKTQSSYSTYRELKHAFEHHVPIFPLKLCDAWPPRPPKDHDGGSEGWEQNNVVFTKDLIYHEWSKKKWDAAECAKEVKAGLEKIGKCPLTSSGNEKMTV